MAIGTFVALRSRSSESSAGRAEPSAVDPRRKQVVPVSAASIYDFGSLDELVEASDLVVRGRVEATSRGRAVGSDANAVVSRIVTVRVEEVLAGSVATPSVLVEEEGWLVDGRPVEVNGLAPSHEGMEAIWFLDALPPGELPGYLVINHQGRYALDGDRSGGRRRRRPARRGGRGAGCRQARRRGPPPRRDRLTSGLTGPSVVR